MKLEPEFRPLWEAYSKRKDARTLRELLIALAPTIEKGVKTFGGGMPNLYAKAKLIAVNALNNYSPNEGRLKDYVMLHLQRLRRIAPQTGNIVSVPEMVRLGKRNLEEAQRELEDRFNRPPTDQELADYLGLSIKKLSKLQAASGAVLASAFEGDTGEIKDQGISKNAAELLKESVYKELSPLQQYIMERRFGLHNHKEENIEEIAKKLKISVGQVHNHIQKIQNMLTGIEQFLSPKM